MLCWRLHGGGRVAVIAWLAREWNCADDDGHFEAEVALRPAVRPARLDVQDELVVDLDDLGRFHGGRTRGRYGKHRVGPLDATQRLDAAGAFFLARDFGDDTRGRARLGARVELDLLHELEEHVAELAPAPVVHDRVEDHRLAEHVAGLHHREDHVDGRRAAAHAAHGDRVGHGLREPEARHAVEIGEAYDGDHHLARLVETPRHLDDAAQRVAYFGIRMLERGGQRDGQLDLEGKRVASALQVELLALAVGLLLLADECDDQVDVQLVATVADVRLEALERVGALLVPVDLGVAVELHLEAVDAHALLDVEAHAARDAAARHVRAIRIEQRDLEVVVALHHCLLV